MKILNITVAALAGLLCAGAASAQTGGKTVDRLYLLDCGKEHLADLSKLVSPGENVGVPSDFLVSCYLIHGANGYFLWETGVPDALVATPATPAPNALIVQSRTKTLASQLEALKVKPSDIKYVAVSHLHGDHAGNVDLFPTSTLLLQKAEYDFAFAPGKKPPFPADRPVEKVEGDKDVYGDGSVLIVSTPGHTPGHQSLLVHLTNTGWVMLTGDAVLTQEAWDKKWVSPLGDKEKVAASMDRIGVEMAKHKAQLWSSHDPKQADQLRAAKKYYE